MQEIFTLLLSTIVTKIRRRAWLELEVLALRHQLVVLERRQTSRPRLTSADRLFWVWLYRLWPCCLDAVVIVKPETVIRWHRRGFRLFWRWKPDRDGGDGHEPP